MKKAIVTISGVLCSLLLNAQIVCDSLDFERASGESAATLLRGKVSGVRISTTDGAPNGQISTVIRGINSTFASAQPLWIVDGVMLSDDLSKNLNAFWQRGGTTTKGDAIPDYSGCSYTSELNGLGFLNPYDIESIEVLKNLSSTAAYGSEGANGVVIVNTKNAKKAGKQFFWSSNMIVGEPSEGNKIFNTSIGHNHTFSFYNNTNNTSFAVSAFYRDNNAYIPDTGSRYGGVNISLESAGHPIFGFGLKSQLSVGEQKNPSGPSYFGTPSHTMLARFPEMFPDNSFDGWVEDYDDDVLDYRALTSAWFDVNFTKFLTWRNSIGIDFQNNTRSIWYGLGTSFGKENNGAASILSSSLFNYNWKSELSFNRYFNQDYNLQVRLMAEGLGDFNSYSVMNGTTFDLPYLRAKGLSVMGSRAMPFKFKSNYSRYGTMAYARFSWKECISADVMYRADFTPKYFSKPVSYPAANMMFDLHRLIFPDFDIVSGLRLKGGYGSAGCEEYIPYRVLSNYVAYHPVVETGTEQYYDGLSRIYSTEWNAGLELGFANRVELGVQLYQKKTLDSFDIFNFGKMAGDYWVWADNGTIVYETSSSLSNRGVEMDLRADVIATNDWHWSLAFRTAYNMNIVHDIDYEQMLGEDIGDGNTFNVNTNGSSVASLYGYEYAEDGSFCDRNADGVFSDADKVILGNTLPKWMGSFETVLKFRNFSFDLCLDGAAGHQIANLNRMYGDAQTDLSPKYIEDADYVRLSRISLSYRIPVKSKHIDRLNVHLSANNVATLTKYSGWNPEVSCFGVNPQSHGLDYGSYPILRSFVIGVNMNF